MFWIGNWLSSGNEYWILIKLLSIQQLIGNYDVDCFLRGYNNICYSMVLFMSRLVEVGLRLYLETKSLQIMWSSKQSFKPGSSKKRLRNSTIG
jgi:hypothetical protein